MTQSIKNDNGIDQSMFRDIVELNEAGLILLEKDMVKYANAAFCNVLGKEANEVIGHSILRHIDEENRAVLSQYIQAIDSRKIKRYSNNFKCKSNQGAVKYFSLHLKAIEKPTGQVQIVGASRESTERVLNKEENLRVNKKFEALYRNMPDGIIVYDYETDKVIDCNQAALKMLGYEKDELVGLSKTDLVPRASKMYGDLAIEKTFAQHWERVLNGESFYSFGIFQTKQGEERYTNMNVIPTFVEKSVAYFVIHDATREIKNAHEVKVSRKKYQAIFQNSHEAISYFEINSGKLLDCNKNTLELFGAANRSELMNLPKSNFHENFFKNSDHGALKIREKIHEAIEKGQAYVTVEAKKLTGEKFVYDGVFVADMSDPKSPKLLTFARDIKNIRDAEKEKNKLISKLIEAQKEINERNTELKKYIESNLQLENFAYFASHDLRTPLRSIISFTQLLNRSLKEKASREELEYMAFIIESGKNMQRLIDDLLSFSRINASEAKFEEINFTDFIQGVQNQMVSAIEEKEAEINLRQVPTSIFADSTKLKQLFQNLISNAIKFVPQGKRPKVEISAREDKSHWQFSIKDNGIGIDKAYEEKVFLMFKRLHNNLEYEGTGIGLALCKKVIEQHQGKIWFDSRLGEGTTFHFTIKKELSSYPPNGT